MISALAGLLASNPEIASQAAGAVGAGGTGAGGSGIIGSAGGVMSSGGGGNDKQLALGAGQMAVGLYRRSRAKKLLPSESDPITENELLNVERKIRSINTGTSNNRLVSSVVENLNPKTFNSGRGFQKGLNQVASVVGKAMVQINSEKEKNEAGLIGLRSEINKRRADRALQLGMFKHLSEKALAEENIQSGMANILSYVSENQEIDVNTAGAGSESGDPGGGAIINPPNNG